MSFNNKNGNDNGNNAQHAQQRPQGKEEVFNKLSFTSVKLGQTKQGSATMTLYMGRDQMEKAVGLMQELLSTPVGDLGCKLSVICIEGKSYTSGYAYLNPKEPKKEGSNNYVPNGQTQAAPQNNSYGRQRQGNFGNKESARSFLESKRINDGKQGQ